MRKKFLMFYAKERVIDEQMDKKVFCVSCQLYPVIRMVLHNGINRLIYFCCSCLINGKCLISVQLCNKTDVFFFVPNISETLLLIPRSPWTGRLCITGDCNHVPHWVVNDTWTSHIHQNHFITLSWFMYA